MTGTNSHRKLSQCIGKDSFESFEKAAQGVSNKLKHLVRPYHCRVCQQYHVGSIENHRQRQLAQKRLKEGKK